MMTETRASWKDLVLVCFFLGHFQLLLSALLADISDCSGSNYLVFNEGSNMSLCCKLGGKPCGIITWSDNFTLVFENSTEGPVNYMVTRLDKCLVRMDVTNISERDAGWYNCTVNNQVYYKKMVVIYGKLPTINITKFVCTYDKIMTVTFDRGVPGNDPILYTVSMIKSMRAGTWPEISMCSEKISSRSGGTMCQSEDRECVCHYSDTHSDGDSLLRTYNVTIIITQHRAPNQTQLVNRTFSVLDNAIPGPLNLMELVNVSTNQAVIKACTTDDNTGFLINFTDGVIFYHVLVCKTQGVPEQLSVIIPTIPRFCCLRIRLRNLPAFMSYSVKIFLIGGGGSGNETRIDFTTSTSVPTGPPKLDVYSFLRYSKPDNDGKGTQAIIIMWHPLPIEAHGGSNLSYFVRVTSLSGFNVSQTVTDSYAFFAGESLRPNLVVRIWAQNIMGLTEHYSELKVPDISDTRTVATHVELEFDDDKATVYVHLYDPRNVVQLLIHSCQNYTDTTVPGISLCQERPVIVFNTSSIEETMQFKINFTMTDQHQEFTETTVMEYRHATQSSIDSEEYKLAHDTASTQRLCTQRFLCCDTNGDIKPTLEPAQPLSIRKRYVQNTARRKRYLWSHDGGYAMDILERQPREANALLKGVDKTGIGNPLMFISLVTMDEGNGRTRHGLIPVDCYFNRQKATEKDALKVDVHNIVAVDDSRISLDWNQTCQGKQSDQFRADYFCTSESADGDCESARCHTRQYYNKIDEHHTIYVSRTNYTCFYAYTNDSNYAYKKWPEQSLQYLPNDKSSTVPQPGVVAGGAIGGFVVFFLCLLCAYFCYRRGKRIRAMSSGIVQLSSVENYITDTVTTNKRHASESAGHSCSDSGRGSGLDEIGGGYGETLQLELLDQAKLCASGSRNSATVATNSFYCGDYMLTAENNGHYEEVGVVEMENSGMRISSEEVEVEVENLGMCISSEEVDVVEIENSGMCISSEASGHFQSSDDEDLGNHSVITSSKKDGELMETEDEITQQEKFEEVGLQFCYHSSGDSQISSSDRVTDEGDEYSRSVVYSGGSNSSYEEKKERIVMEEED